MSTYKDRYVAIREGEDVGRLSIFVDELISIVECYEAIYGELKDVVNGNFLNKNKNKTVFLTDIVKGGMANGSGSKRDITVIKGMDGR